MEIRVLFDDTVSSCYLESGFGLSLLIDGTIIFDTGSDGSKLIHNLKTQNVAAGDIDSVVISHEHWDHVDGLEKLLGWKQAMVYISSGFSGAFETHIQDHGGVVTTAYSPVFLKENIFTTGEIEGLYKNEPIAEQGIIIEYRPNRGALISGCAHYGIFEGIRIAQDNIEKVLGRSLRIDTVVGGLHLRHKSDTHIVGLANRLKEIGIKKVF